MIETSRDSLELFDIPRSDENETTNHWSNPSQKLEHSNSTPEERIHALFLVGEPLTALLESRVLGFKHGEALANWISFQKLDSLRLLLRDKETFMPIAQLLEWRLWLRLYGAPDPDLDASLCRQIRKLWAGDDSEWKRVVETICDADRSFTPGFFLESSGVRQKTFYRLLSTGVLFRRAIQHASSEISAKLGTEYESLSLYTSQGRCDDVFGIRRSVQRSVQSLPPDSLLKRGRKILSCSYRLAGALGWGRVASLLSPGNRRRKLTTNEQEKIIPILTQTLSDLRGPLMKVGQILSYFSIAPDSALPGALRILQQSATAMPYSTVRQQIERALKVPFESLFRTFDFEPLGAGSMAQVHRATLRDGREVAVKVLFPGIREIIQTDIRYLELASPLLTVLAPHMGWRTLLKELETGFLNEGNLLREAKMQRLMRDAYTGIDDIIIPKVIAEWSSEDVMMMECIRGQRLEDFAQTASREALNRAGGTITKLALSTSKNSIFNSDPNPGNYLFMDDGRVAFLDFGATVEWTRELTDIWTDICLASVDGNFELFKHAVNRGFMLERCNDKDLRTIFAVVAPEDCRSWWKSKRIPIEQHFLSLCMKQLFTLIADSKFGFKINPRFILGMRIYFGHLSVVSELGACKNWSELVREECSHSFGAR